MIDTTREGPVLAVRLDRPDRRNALTGTGLEQLEAALAEADAPVVYLHGAGAAFCAGADLDVVDALDGDEAAAFARRGQAVANALSSYDGVTVAGVDGAARGGGVELALACDLRVCTPAATFAETGVTLGLFGAWGGTHRLPAVVGRGAAMDLALSGRVVDAEEALRMGLVSRVTEDPRAVAAAVAEGDPTALATIKGLLADPAPPERQEEREREAFRSLVERRARKRKR